MNIDQEVREFIARIGDGLSLEEYVNNLEVLVEEASAALDAALEDLDAQEEDE